MLRHSQLHEMVSVGARLHKKSRIPTANPNKPFPLAVISACVGLTSHSDWLSTKSRLQSDLADLFYFYVCEMLDRHDGNIDAAESMLRELFEVATTEETLITFDKKVYEVNRLDALGTVELLIGLAAAQRICVGVYGALLEIGGITWDDLYQEYIGKHLLDAFRYEHGFRTGGYVKVWKGRKDHEHLLDILASTDASSPTYTEDIWRALEARYPVRPEIEHI